MHFSLPSREVNLSIRVQREDFDIGTEVGRLTSGNHGIGGVCSFVGLVRDIADHNTLDRLINSMTLEHYPGMTEKALQKIETEAWGRWPLEQTLIIHRYGRLEAGEKIVLVAAASAHRNAAIEACQFLIDWLKTKAPFWKLEDISGNKRWVDARESDGQASARWEPGDKH